MPNEVIDQLHRMARQEHGNTGLIFEDRNHIPLVDPDDDDDDDSTYHPEDEDDINDNDDSGDEGDDDGGPAPPPVLAVGPPEHDNPPDNLEGNVHPNHHDDQVDPLDDHIQLPNQDNPEMAPNNNNVGEDEEVPPSAQEEESSVNSVTEQLPDNHSVPNNEYNRTPMMPNDPTLPPRAQREIKRLANDGVGPTIYHGRTRSQTYQPEHNMLTTGQP